MERALVAFLLVGLTMSACAPSPELKPQATLTFTATLTPSPTLAATATPTPSPTPTATATLTPSPAPTATATPIPPPTPTATAKPTATPTPLPRRLATGTFIKDSPRGGHGELTIRNELSGRDAVAVLTPAGSDSPLIAVYIRAGDSFTVQGIEDGAYELYFTLGEDWDDQPMRFTRKARLERFKDLLSFQTIPVTGGIQYTSIEVTLYAVPGGTAETETVPEEGFPDLRH